MLSVSIARRIIMKATKKILCITLALVVAGLALIMPISASSADLPVIVVDGIGTTPLYQNFGTPDEKLVFDDATIESFKKGFVKMNIVESVMKRYRILNDSFVEKLLECCLNEQHYQFFNDWLRYEMISKDMYDKLVDRIEEGKQQI